MKVVHVETVLEFDEALEEGVFEHELPYNVSRIEDKDGIIIFGYYTNWMFDGNMWQMLVGNNFVPCEEPPHEKLYREWKKQSEYLD